MPEVHVDLITRDQDNTEQLVANGQVASKILGAGQGGLHINNFRPFIGDGGGFYVNTVVPKSTEHPDGLKAIPISANAALRRDEWIHLDEAVLKISRERLGGVEDLLSRGLTYNLTNPMGRTVLEYHDMDDPGEANLTMDGVTRNPNDAPSYSTNYIPLPIIHADFTFNQRLLETSRNMGESIDTTMVEAATRRVLEKLEDIVFTDDSYAFGGGTIYGYLNHPSINTVTLSQNWDNSGKTAVEIKNDCLALKQASINAKHYGPWMMYIPTAYETVLDDDYDTTTATGRTIRERILQIDGIVGIKVVDRLTANNIAFVQMTSDVVRLINGFGPRVVQWSTQGGMVHNFKVMAIQVPQIRADQAGNSGVTLLAA